MDTRQAACILAWRARNGGAQPKLEVLLVQRAQAMAIMAGFWALPGGQLDPEDEELARSLAQPGAALALAALRELFEETGLVPQHSARLPRQAREQLRRDLLSHERGAAQVLQRLGLHAPTVLGQLVPMGRWQTPPFATRRFVAQYFALQLCDHADAHMALAPKELSQAHWLTPEAALWAHEHNEAYLAMPVRHTLLALHNSCGSPHARIAEAARTLEQHDSTRRLEVGLADGLALMPVKSPTLPPSTHTNCYVVGQGTLAVVDPGTPYPDETERLLAVLRARVAAGERIEAVWLTHFHPDHVGAAEAMRTAFGMPVCAHLETAERLAGRVRIDRILRDDELLPVGRSTWRALYTPGHAPGHLCFWEQERGHLLAGDNVLGAGTSIVMPRPEGDMAAYFKSLERLSTLRLGMLLPGHGPPIATSLKRLSDTLSQRRARERLIVATVEQLVAKDEPATLTALVGQVYRGLAAGLRGLGELSTRAHLEKLVDDGRLVRRGEANDHNAQWLPP